MVKEGKLPYFFLHCAQCFTYPSFFSFLFSSSTILLFSLLNFLFLFFIPSFKFYYFSPPSQPPYFLYIFPLPPQPHISIVSLN